MARTARKHSDSGVYHVILRGVNKQQIFECTEDYQRFLNILRTLTVQEQDESVHRSKPNWESSGTGSSTLKSEPTYLSPVVHPLVVLLSVNYM